MQKHLNSYLDTAARVINCTGIAPFFIDEIDLIDKNISYMVIKESDHLYKDLTRKRALPDFIVFKAYSFSIFNMPGSLLPYG